MLSLPARLATISFITPAAAWSLAPVPEGVPELRVAAPWPIQSGDTTAAAETWVAVPALTTAAPRHGASI